MNSKNPDRYGKNKRSVSTTVPLDVYQEMEKLAASGGLKLTAWARLALTEAARSEAVYGLSKLKALPFYTPETMKAAEEPGASMSDPSDEYAGGSETAREPVQYTPKRRTGGK
jgi:hypothetical protein